MSTGQISLPGKPGPLSPEIRFSSNSPFPDEVLSPADYKGPYTLFLNEWPNEDYWKQILVFFPFENEFELARYYSKIAGRLPRTDKEIFLKAAGYSYGKEKELLAMAGYSSAYVSLRLEKNIPVKLIEMVRKQDDGEKTALLLASSSAKPNMVRQMLVLWVDLKKEEKESFYDEFQLLQSSHKSPDILGQKAYELLRKQRYPSYEQTMEPVRRLVSSLPKPLEVEYDPLLETQYFQISAKIQSKEKLKDFVETLNKDEVRNILRKLCEILLDNA